MKKLLALLILSLYPFFTSYAEEVESFQYMGDNLLLPIPDGFCNATEELSGIFIMDYINSQISNGIDATKKLLFALKIIILKFRTISVRVSLSSGIEI